MPISDTIEMQFNHGKPLVYTLHGKHAAGYGTSSRAEGSARTGTISVIPSTRIEALQLYRLRLMAVASPVGTWL